MASPPLQEDNNESQISFPHTPKKGYWYPEEDQKLIQLMSEGNIDWAIIASKFENRSAKQCRERWNEYLSPTIDHSPFTIEEDFIILRSQAKIGNKWKEITDLLPVKDPKKRRTPTSVKVQWHCLERKIRRAGSNQFSSSPSWGDFESTRFSSLTSTSSFPFHQTTPPSPSHLFSNSMSESFHNQNLMTQQQQFFPMLPPPGGMEQFGNLPQFPSSGHDGRNPYYFPPPPYSSSQELQTNNLSDPARFNTYGPSLLHSQSHYESPPLDYTSSTPSEQESYEWKHESELPSTTPNPHHMKEADLPKEKFDLDNAEIPTSKKMRQASSHSPTPDDLRPGAYRCDPPNSIPPLYVTAQLPHLISHPGADFSIFSANGPFGPFSPHQFVAMFDPSFQSNDEHLSPR